MKTDDLRRSEERNKEIKRNDSERTKWMLLDRWGYWTQLSLKCANKEPVKADEE